MYGVHQSTGSAAVARARTKNERGQGERLRRELLDAANAILDQKADPAALTVRGVAAAVGVAPNAVYLHFADRDELLAAVMVDRFQDFGERIRSAMDAASDPADKLRAGNRAYLAFAAEHPAHYRLLFGPGEVRPERADLAEQVMAVGAAAFELCVEACRTCVEHGLVGDVDPEALAAVVWAMEHGYASLACTPKADLLPAPDTLVDTFLAAAAPRRRRSGR